jgi:hypothetical protein
MSLVGAVVTAGLLGVPQQAAAQVTTSFVKLNKPDVKQDPNNANAWIVTITGSMGLAQTSQSVRDYTFYFRDPNNNQVAATMLPPFFSPPGPGQTANFTFTTNGGSVALQGTWMVFANFHDDQGRVFSDSAGFRLPPN